MCKLDIYERGMDLTLTNELVEDESHKKIKGYILMNPEDIYEFISTNDEYIVFLNIVLDLIKLYFKYSVSYLRFEEDIESIELNALIIFIVNEGNSYDENNELLKLMKNDLKQYRDVFPKVYQRVIIFVDENDDFCKRAMSCYEKYGHF